MITTVANILDLDELSGAELVAGGGGLGNTVNNAALMEVPDIFSYVDKDNLLVTTLYPISNDEEAKRDIIPKLSELGLAGICIKPGRYVDKIPSIMIQQADELNFPIIQLPEDANLSNIAVGILEISLEQHIRTLDFRNRVHKTLSKLFLNGADIETLVNSLADMVEHPIILLDDNANMMYVSKDLIQYDVDIVKGGMDDFIIQINNRIYNRNSYIKHLIVAGGTRFGYLILLGKNMRQKSMVMAIEQAAFLMAAAFYRIYSILEKERSFQDALVRDILAGRVQSNIDAINRAKTFNWRIDFPQIMMAIKIISDNEEDMLKSYEYILDRKVIERLLDRRQIIDRDSIKVAYMDGMIIVFMGAASMRDIKRESIEIAEVILDELGGRGRLSIGISNPVLNVEEFPTRYDEVCSSAMIGKALNGMSSINHYDDYRIFDIIMSVRDRDVLRKYVEDQLGDIISYDRTENMNLIETIRVLIDENLNMKRAAETLFVHYNTLRYRVGKLRELGMDLDDGTNVGDISIALSIYLWLVANDDWDI
ncbi:MAG: PucR family transcriptional regulator [Tissierellia bacterium]|nr:PucR family transcriptional regulator [Tissierellia bacterium]